MTHAPEWSDLQHAVIERQLERVVTSKAFSASTHLQQLLRYLVEETLAGRAERLNQYTVAMDVLERDAKFDPSIDSIVRVDAGRLRTKLREYYYDEGQHDEIKFDLPKGHYVPHFIVNSQRNKGPDVVTETTGKAHFWYITQRVSERISGLFKLRTLVILIPSLCILAVLVVLHFDSVRVASSLAHVLPNQAPLALFDPPQNAIAVLPFSNHSRDAADAYFGEVMTDELINAFSRVPHLLVSGRTSVNAVVLAGLDLKQIGRRLNVSRLLEGSVKVEDDRVQISVQLIDAASGFEIWSQVFEKQLTDLSSVQMEIGDAIAASAAPKLIANSDIGRVFKAGGCDAIYPMIMRASFLRQRDAKKNLKQRTAGYQRALTLMQEATEISPGCALAWDGLVSSYRQLCLCVDRQEQQVLYQIIVPLINKAIELNPDLPGPWLSRSHYAEFERRWIDAEDYMVQALAKAPNDAHVLTLYAENIGGRGRVREALEVMLRAYRLDPVNATTNNFVALFATLANESDLVLRHARIADKLSGESNYWLRIADGHLLKGEVSKALQLYRPHFYLGDTEPTLADRANDGRFVPSWYQSCILASSDPGQISGARAAYRRAFARLKDPQSFFRTVSFESWWIKSCALFVGDTDWLVPKMLGDPPFSLTIEDNLVPFWAAESKWTGAGKSMRAHPLFHRFIRDTGLLAYWRRFGWPDFCEPDGNGFTCDRQL